MLTWSMVYMTTKKAMVPETYLPFFVAMGCDTAMVYFMAAAIGAR
jgi:hypothetical protein